MKRICLSVCLLVCLPVLLLAQQIDYPSYNHRIITNTFIDNWFVGVGGDYSASYSNQEHGAAYRLGKSPFNADRSVATLNLSLGKWITHTFALRFKMNGFTSKRVGLVHSDVNGERVFQGDQSESYRQCTYELQPILNLHNLIGGYKERIWSANLYCGMGLAHNYENDVENDTHFSSLVGTIGLLNTFNVSRRVHVNVDISASAAEAQTDRVSLANRFSFLKGRDCIVRFGIGIGINLGKVGWQKGPDMGSVQSINQAEVDALNMTIEELEAENERLRDSQGEVDCEIPEAPEVEMYIIKGID